MIHGFFDVQFRLNKIDTNGDPLIKLNKTINWKLFLPTVNTVRDKERKGVGPKGYDSILLLKMLILQSLYNLSDDQIEYQVLDRLSFMRFLGLSIGDKVPDATTLWRFREALKEAKLIKTLFKQFDIFLRQNGFEAKKGQIIDASIVNVPKQRNSREDNDKIKEGTMPKGWSENKSRQKDVDARWTKKRNTSYFGYKNHIQTDVKYKFIRDFCVTNASVYDINVFEELLDIENSNRDVFADSAYRSEKKLKYLKHRDFREHIQRKGARYVKLGKHEKRGNRTRAKTRCRVEHVFGFQKQKAGNMILRSIGLLRARLKIGLRNLAYNLDRYAMLKLAS